MPNPLLDLGAWCVIGTPTGFTVARRGADALDAGDILAFYPDRAAAEDGMNRAIMMLELANEKYREPIEREQALRANLGDARGPKWFAALEHELALRNGIRQAVQQAARPRPKS